MRPPYELLTPILKLIASISEKIGEARAIYIDKPSPQLRKQNQIKTIHASLQIEGNTLTAEQVTALIENKRVIGPLKDVQEVVNAIAVYENLNKYLPYSSKSFLAAHKVLMKGLMENPGKYRTENVGIAQGAKIAHLAPPPGNVHYLMEDLFNYLKKDDELVLVKSCVFHYEMEFIHPFLDGNGRMGRLWQTLILIQEYPIFEHLPFETLISRTQQAYYDALSKSDKAGASTIFIEYMLGVIDKALTQLLSVHNRTMSSSDRLLYFTGICNKEFTRSDYCSVFKGISSATASRDLKTGVDRGYFDKSGDKRNTIYRLKQG